MAVRAGDDQQVLMPTLDWIARKAVINHHRDVSYHLIACNGKLSIDSSDTRNMLLEGDNLLALKALLPYYAGKVRCIYIDPPYNTGKEGWKYNDNVNSPEIAKWLGQVVGKELEDLSRHDKWLCMMYPRLSLLREFLTEDGVVFISIGKDEIGNLRELCDEIFGVRNHIETLIWQIEGNVENQEDITTTHEYVLAYSRQPDHPKINIVIDPNVDDASKLLRDFAENSVIKNGPANPASVVELPAGFPCAVENLDLPAHAIAAKFLERVASDGGYIQPDLRSEFGTEYPIRLDNLIVENGELVNPCRVFSGWSSARKFRRFNEIGCVPLREDDGSTMRFFLTNTGVPWYRREGREAHFVPTILRNMGTTERSANELARMGIRFPYPKPVTLVEYLISLYARSGDIVLDSFAGSGTTGNAVLQLNAKGANLSFILVELDSEIAKTVTAKRLACNAKGFLARRGAKEVRVPGLGGGFKYCQLSEPLFDSNGQIDQRVSFSDLAAHVYFTETGQPLPRKPKTPLLGVHEGRAIYLVFNGILSNGMPRGSNLLTVETLGKLPPHDGPKIIFADGCRLSKERLQREHSEFKQIPYAIKVN